MARMIKNVAAHVDLNAKDVVGFFVLDEKRQKEILNEIEEMARKGVKVGEMLRYIFREYNDTELVLALAFFEFLVGFEAGWEEAITELVSNIVEGGN